MKHVHMDFETRSCANLKKVGAFRYAEDPTTEVMSLSWKYSDSSDVYTWIMWAPKRNADKLRELSRFISRGGIVKAHNAEFEFAIWNRCFIKQIGRLAI